MSIPLEETPVQAARRLLASYIGKGYELAGVHEYRDAQGDVAFWRIRCKHADGRKVIRPMRRNGSGFALGEPQPAAAGKPLYRLQELLAAAPDALVWVVEGEGCADALADLGMVATTSGSCTSAGAANWQPLAGRRVRLWPDNDAEGSRYAADVEGRLSALNAVVELLALSPLGLPPKGDCVDWLLAHRDAAAVDVETLAVARHPRVAVDVRPRVELMRGDTITPEPVDWLWKDWLASGKLHLIGGQPGTGKTTIAVALAAAVSAGAPWPDGTHAARGTVVFWSGEDDPRDTLSPRLRVAGADMERVHVVSGVLDGSDRYPFDPARDVDALRETLARLPDVRLLVVDPIVSAIAGDSHKNAEVRRGLQPLVDLAHEFRCALLGVTHFTKGTAGRDPIERITGSLAFGALARIVLVTAKAESNEDGAARRFLARAKSNIGPDGGAFSYELQQVEVPGFTGIMASRVQWGAALEGTARDLLADAEVLNDSADSRRDVVAWIRETLTSGPMPANEVKRLAMENGFAWRTVQRAMTVAGAESRRGGFQQPAAWQLTSRATPTAVAPVAPSEKLGAIGATGQPCAEDGESPRPQSPLGGTCTDCRHHKPDPLNPTGGIGRCELDPARAFYPMQEHACADFAPDED